MREWDERRSLPLRTDICVFLKVLRESGFIFQVLITGLGGNIRTLEVSGSF